ncbi:MAG: circadian clock protein KaiC [Candidatus Eisenbacteria bacterium]
MEAEPKIQEIDKHETGIPGFDLMARGGLPRCRSTLIAGTSGSGKTILAGQFLVEGIRKFDEHGVFVTFEESTVDIRKNFLALGWDVPKWESQGKWAFVDASPVPGQEILRAGRFDLGALLARIEHAVKKVGAKRVSLDSPCTIFSQMGSHATLRSELSGIMSALKKWGVTTMFTAERTQEMGGVARYGVEEFLADNVVIIRNLLEDERRHRTIEILKFRGADHENGQQPFTITPDRGIVITPLSSIELKQVPSGTRIPSGNPRLDELCDGGHFDDSIILVSGPTGTGKTLMATEFIGRGAEGDRCLWLAFEESKDQIFRNGTGWGIDLAAMEAAGRLSVACAYPETLSLRDHLARIKTLIDKHRPNRLALDSLSALGRASTFNEFREFLVGLTSTIKQREIAAMITITTQGVTGLPSATETHMSTIADTVILLRYVEIYGEIHRGIAVLKMRGSGHDKEIREFTVDASGMHIGDSFRNISGIISGQVHCGGPGDGERIGMLSPEERCLHN